MFLRGREASIVARRVVIDATFMALVHLLQSLQDNVASSEHSIGQQEGVEEIYAEEPQICQPV